nr:MAG TPA: hypothetical protein [Caudoviricetes sp.]
MFPAFKAQHRHFIATRQKRQVLLHPEIAVQPKIVRQKIRHAMRMGDGRNDCIAFLHQPGGGFLGGMTSRL